MSATSVIGLQWGDEAKGKIVDLLADQHDIVVRYQGGNNAGHTIVFGGTTYKLSLLPAGVLHPGVTSVIASGVVVNPQALLAEIDAVTAQNGTGIGTLLVSDRAHVIFPYHVLEEKALETSLGKNAIGTTLRGIGMCYRDKVGRAYGIRIGDLVRPDYFRQRLDVVVPQKNAILRALDPSIAPVDADAVYNEYSTYMKRIGPLVADTNAYLHAQLAQGKRLLFEGAQGSLLDIDHGTFPFVTSSNSSGCGLHSGSGVPERAVTRLVGVAKAYTSRVGAGPFPTELDNEIGQRIRDVGREYGTVTGRPRRCGWFDAVGVGYAARLSGVDCLAITLLDVLDQFDEVYICDEYEIDGERTTDFPSHLEDLTRAIPVYRRMQGWGTATSNCKRVEGFPKETRAYLDTISELVDAPVEIISVGPDRDQTIFVK